MNCHVCRGLGCSECQKKDDYDLLRVVMVFLMLAATFAGVILLSGCTTTCESGAICGSSNTVSPTSIVTTTVTNPTPSPTASATPGCVPQTGPFVCVRGTPVFEAVLLDAQRAVPAAPQPIYVEALVKALNQRSDVCAIAGPSPDEVSIKARVSNAHSETWDVVRADGAIQAIPAAPLNVCSPARW